MQTVFTEQILLTHSFLNQVVQPDLTESEFSYLTKDYELMQQFQHLLEEERGALSQYHTTLPSAPDTSLIDLSVDDMQQWHLIQNHDLNEQPMNSPELVHTAHRVSAVDERIQDTDNKPSATLPPSSDVAAAVCMMVEDPYFDTPISSPSSESASVDPVEDTEDWTFSPIFSAPTLCLNDLVLEPASGKWSCSLKMSYAEISS